MADSKKQSHRMPEDWCRNHLLKAIRNLGITLTDEQERKILKQCQQ